MSQRLRLVASTASSQASSPRLLVTQRFRAAHSRASNAADRSVDITARASRGAVRTRPDSGSASKPASSWSASRSESPDWPAATASVNAWVWNSRGDRPRARARARESSLSPAGRLPPA